MLFKSLPIKKWDTVPISSYIRGWSRDIIWHRFNSSPFEFNWWHVLLMKFFSLYIFEFQLIIGFIVLLYSVVFWRVGAVFCRYKDVWIPNKKIEKSNKNRIDVQITYSKSWCIWWHWFFNVFSVLFNFYQFTQLYQDHLTVSLLFLFVIISSFNLLQILSDSLLVHLVNNLKKIHRLIILAIWLP